MAITVGVNSWVSIDDALALAQERVDLDDFVAYADQDSNSARVEAALIQAHHAIARYQFLVPGFYSVRPEPFLVTSLSEEEFASLPGHFLYSLRLAQVLEAGNLLGLGDALEQQALLRRRAGITEETVGQSSTKFAPLGSLQVDSPASITPCSKALGMLSCYIYRTVLMARA